MRWRRAAYGSVRGFASITVNKHMCYIAIGSGGGGGVRLAFAWRSAFAGVRLAFAAAVRPDASCHSSGQLAALLPTCARAHRPLVQLVHPIVFTNKSLLSQKFAFPFFMTTCNNGMVARLLGARLHLLAGQQRDPRSATSCCPLASVRRLTSASPNEPRLHLSLLPHDPQARSRFCSGWALAGRSCRPAPASCWWSSASVSRRRPRCSSAPGLRARPALVLHVRPALGLTSCSSKAAARP